MDKAYIVANEQQEREVLDKLERWGTKWSRSKKNPTDFIPSHVNHITKLPYALLVENDQISWCDIEALYEFDDIVYDGRKEEKMSDKYVVSQEFMNSLNEWRENLSDFSMSENFVGPTAIDELDDIVDGWWNITDLSGEEQNSRLIAILSWVNGEDVFEVEKPKKWAVRSKDVNDVRDCLYVHLSQARTIDNIARYFTTNPNSATKFDTKEEAESWANAHQEVVEIGVGE